MSCKSFHSLIKVLQSNAGCTSCDGTHTKSMLLADPVGATKSRARLLENCICRSHLRLLQKVRQPHSALVHLAEVVQLVKSVVDDALLVQPEPQVRVKCEDGSAPRRQEIEDALDPIVEKKHCFCVGVALSLGRDWRGDVDVDEVEVFVASFDSDRAASAFCALRRAERLDDVLARAIPGQNDRAACSLARERTRCPPELQDDPTLH